MGIAQIGLFPLILNNLTHLNLPSRSMSDKIHWANSQSIRMKSRQKNKLIACNYKAELNLRYFCSDLKHLRESLQANHIACRHLNILIFYHYNMPKHFLVLLDCSCVYQPSRRHVLCLKGERSVTHLLISSRRDAWLVFSTTFAWVASENQVSV